MKTIRRWLMVRGIPATSMRCAFLSCLCLCLLSCGGGPRARFGSALEARDVTLALEAYEDFRRTEGADHDLLGHVAALLLAEEARSDSHEARAAALLQLSLAGTHGEPILWELAQEEGVGPARLGALQLLARRNKEEARLALRGLADRDEPEILAAAISGMDAELDRGLLLEHLVSPHVDVRYAAARALRGAAAEDAVREALAQAARGDDEARVRSAAVRALGGSGPSAVDALRERLGDPTSSVRLAAVSALMHADEDRARIALAPLLEVAPSPAGIEAARLLAAGDSESAAAARQFLREALTASESALRSQAGVALTGLPVESIADAPIAAVRAALLTEQDTTVRLQFARALLTSARAQDGESEDAALARTTLEALLREDGLPRVQAAVLLVRGDHEEARAALREIVSSDAASVVRRTAVRGLAREAMQPESVRSHLQDADALVRIYAAGGILAAAAAG